MAKLWQGRVRIDESAAGMAVHAAEIILTLGTFVVAPMVAGALQASKQAVRLVENGYFDFEARVNTRELVVKIIDDQEKEFGNFILKGHALEDLFVDIMDIRHARTEAGEPEDLEEDVMTIAKTIGSGILWQTKALLSNLAKKYPPFNAGVNMVLDSLGRSLVLDAKLEFGIYKNYRILFTIRGSDNQVLMEYLIPKDQMDFLIDSVVSIFDVPEPQEVKTRKARPTAPEFDPGAITD